MASEDEHSFQEYSLHKIEEALREKIQTSHETALEGLNKQLDNLVMAIRTEQPLSGVFSSASIAMEAIAPSASVGDKLRWTDIALAVAKISIGNLQAEAYALAYRLVHPLT